MMFEIKYLTNYSLCINSEFYLFINLFVDSLLSFFLSLFISLSPLICLYIYIYIVIYIVICNKFWNLSISRGVYNNGKKAHTEL